MADRVKVGEQPGAIAPVSTSDLIDRLARFDGPPEAFLVNLLAVQCYLSAAGGGAILRASPEGRVEVLAIYPQLPQGQTAPPWLAQSIEHAPGVLTSGGTSLKPLRNDDDLYGAPPRQHLVMVPIRGGSSVRGAACFLVETSDPRTLAICRERLELTVSLLSLYEMRLTLQRRQADMARLRVSLDVLGAINDHERFAGAAMAACNELASRLQAERVSIGFLKGQYVHLKAQSHTEKFSRKMKVVQDIEAAMEECLDQDVEVVHPSSPESTFVARAAKELSTRHGPSAVMSLPVRRKGEVVAVLTVERSIERPFTVDEAEMLRLACDLLAARMVNLHEHDRWFGARMANATRKGLGVLLGPKHTWAKALGILIFGVICFAIFVDGDYTAQASFLVEPTKQQAVPAAFDGYIESIFAMPGDSVMGRGDDRGPWADTTAYVRGEEVAYGPRQYRCKIDHTGVGDGSTSPDVDKMHWKDFDQGAWADKTKYAQGDQVTLGDRTYGCLIAHSGPGDATTSPDQDKKHWGLAVLGKLETTELENELTKARVEHGKAQTSVAIAMAAAEDDRTKLSEAQLAQADADAADEKIKLIERQIRVSSLRSPLGGTVISEDLTRHIRRPVKRGDILFEVAAIHSVRALLEVPEDQITEVQEKVHHGELATAAYPDKKVRFTVDLIYPVAEVVEQKNVFKVRVSMNPEDLKALPEEGEWMRPGYKGTARIHIGYMPYYKLWTRDLVNWVRMKLWI